MCACICSGMWRQIYKQLQLFQLVVTCSECFSPIDNEPVFTLVVWTEPKMIDIHVWGQDYPQLSLIHHFSSLLLQEGDTRAVQLLPPAQVRQPRPLPCGSQGSFLPPGESQEGLLPFQTERSSGSGEETASAQGGWRSGTAAPGALCAMTPGAWQRPRWCVSSWAVARPWKPCGPQGLALEMGTSGWTRCGAGARSPPCGTVLRSPGGRATASMRRMLV